MPGYKITIWRARTAVSGHRESKNYMVEGQNAWEALQFLAEQENTSPHLWKKIQVSETNWEVIQPKASFDV